MHSIGHDAEPKYALCPIIYSDPEDMVTTTEEKMFAMAKKYADANKAGDMTAIHFGYHGRGGVFVTYSHPSAFTEMTVDFVKRTVIVHEGKQFTEVARKALSGFTVLQKPPL